jgi:hypothetical protein
VIYSTENQLVSVILGGLTSTSPAPLLCAAVPGDGAVQQVTTVTFSSPSNSSPYAVSLTDTTTGQTTTLEIETDGSATAAEASALLLAAAQADPIAGSFCSFADDGAGVVTFTVLQPGRAITFAEVTDTGGHMAISTTTAAAAASSYPLGRVVQLSASTGSNQYVASLPDTPTQGTFTTTVTHAASSTYRLSVALRGPRPGENATAVISFASGAAVGDTSTNAVAAINAIAAIYGVAGLIVGSAGSPSGNDFVLTGTLPAGWAFENATADVTGSGAVMTTPAAGTTAGSVPLAGIVYHPGNLSSDTIGGAAPTAIDAGYTVPVARARCRVNVPNLASGSLGVALFYETAAGASRGLLVVTPTATSLPLPGCTLVARNLASTGSASLSQVELA